ncbi:hypothetical protein Acsp03_54360 [Actinomadura sp. NBRC 104412]|uniref:hypothetical protein n=1 Tax=Actinomadura sp. NBRC 104412 TaxID=3032203 RepID=UPI00249FC28F|nr:hypothetical protein [Actinomadura sp. NBRC 104412]GLZ07970.1 hypothetical protein Acsp03_54360 [Actinomadura sp. NBRC 104412]
MIPVLVAISATFLAGAVCGIFAMVVIGIHAEERRVMSRSDGPSRTGLASRRLLTTRTTCDDLPERERVTAGR